MPKANDKPSSRTPADDGPRANSRDDLAAERGITSPREADPQPSRFEAQLGQILERIGGTLEDVQSRLNRLEEMRDLDRDAMHAHLHSGADRDGSGSHEPGMREDLYEELGLLALNNCPPLPGMVQRWIRTWVPGVGDDLQNIARKINQHWVPRPADTIPENVVVPTIKFKDADVIGIQGMILFHRPKAFHDKVAARNRQLTRDMNLGVESDLFRVHDPRSGLGRPMIRRRSGFELGRAGRVPASDSADDL